MKLRPARGDDGVIRGYVFNCPGCERGHIFYTTGPKVWGFDGDMNCPTFTPSLLNTDHPNGDLTKPPSYVCHLNLTKGRVFFHNDCTHAWKGKVYDLPDV